VAAGCLWIVYYIHMELGLVLRETLGLEIMDSFATQSEVFDMQYWIGSNWLGRMGEERALGMRYGYLRGSKDVRMRL